eukprot:15473907-Alexandrium_andersonii.AAC.1
MSGVACASSFHCSGGVCSSTFHISGVACSSNFQTSGVACSSNFRVRHLRETPRRTHPSGASGSNVEVTPGPAQFQVRTPGAMLHFPKLLAQYSSIL